MLPHLMTPEEMDNLSFAVRIDEAETQWAKEFDQLDIRPADGWATQGLVGKSISRLQSLRMAH